MMPRRFLLMMLGLASVPLIVGVWDPSVGQMGVLLTLLIFAVALLDLAISPRPDRVEIERRVSDVLSVDSRNRVSLWLRNPSSMPLFVEVHDEPPPPCSIEELPASVLLKPFQSQEVVYHVKPHRRGRNRFGQVFLRLRSRLHFWELTDRREIPQAVKVYPNIQAVHAVELMARHNRTPETGVRLSLLRGRGTEFDRLREYRREDEYRSIDWKATARTRQLISREYVVERNQNLVILLDCGRSMCNETAGVTHFDRALNAGILLSHVAMKQGDTVSWLAAGNAIHRYIPSLRGAPAMPSLIRQTFDLEPTYDRTDYSLQTLAGHFTDAFHRRCASAGRRRRS